jgi:uncharacterized protein (TIGR02118 family)
MFTVTFVLYEKDGLDRTEALRYWRDTHGPLVGQVPGVQRYVQQHAVGAPDGQPPFLGVASLSRLGGVRRRGCLACLRDCSR